MEKTQHTKSSIIRTIANIPNFPFMLILALYVTYQMWRHSGPVEMAFFVDDPTFSSEFKAYMKKSYPDHFRYVVAVIAYSCLLIWIIRSNIA